MGQKVRYGGLWLHRKNLEMDVMLNCNYYFVILFDDIVCRGVAVFV